MNTIGQFLSDLAIANPPQGLNTPIEVKPKILYYKGTFDPVHSGHLSAVMTAKEQLNISCTIILHDNSKKPYKVKGKPWDVRTKMVNDVFRNVPGVYVSTLPKKTLEEKILSKSFVILLIGSDVFSTRFKKKTTTPFHELCVALRGNSSREGASFDNKQVHYIVPPIRQTSSSDIRKFLTCNPEMYDTSKALNGLYNSPLSQLDPNVLQYILKEKIYYITPEDHIKHVKKKINSYIEKFIFPNKPYKLVCLNDHKEGTHSGNLTFAASSEEKKYFIKVFVKNSHKDDFTNEFRGYSFIKNSALEWCTTVDEIAWQKTNIDYSHIGMSFIQSQNVEKTFISLNQTKNPELENILTSMCFCVGRALAELHNVYLYPVDVIEVEHDIEVLSVKIKQIIDFFEEQKDAEIQLLKSQYEEASNAYLLNPGQFTAMHGDANLGHFFVDLKTGKVTIVDLIKLAENFSKTEEFPLGLPSKDYHQFLSEFDLLALSYPLDKQTIEKAKQKFREGYNFFPLQITPEADNYFDLYWQIRRKFNKYQIENKQKSNK